MSLKMNVKNVVVDIFLQECVEYVFWHTWWHIMHLWEAISGTWIRTIFNKHEWNAVYMADWYTRTSGKIGVILGTAWPWATNMITGLASAYLDSIPLLAICASVDSRYVWRNPSQDGSGRWRSIDQKLAFKSVCKESILVQSPQWVPGAIREAFRISLSWRPWPVYVEIPSDYWRIDIDYNLVEKYKYKNLNLPLCNVWDSNIIKDELYKSKTPLIIIWEWVEEKWITNKLDLFLNSLKVPFAVSPMAKNYVDEFNPYYLWVMRWSGKTQKVYEYMIKSDFVLFLWDRMNQVEMKWYETNLFANNKKLAQVDNDVNEIGRVYPVDYSCIWSIWSFIDLIWNKRHDESEKLFDEIQKLKECFPRVELSDDSEKWVNPVNIINIAEKFAEKDAIIVCDTWASKSLAILKFRTSKTQKFLTVDKNWPMWYSVPASLGAFLASNKEVICFVWDWWFQMSFNELSLCYNYDFKVIYIIFNNNSCYTIKKIQSAIYWNDDVTCFKNPDYMKIAEWFWIESYKVSNSNDFEIAFKKAKKSKVSVLIDVIVDDELIIWE